MGGSVVHPPALSLHPGGVSTAVAGMQLAQPSPCLSFPIQRAGRALGCREQGLELLQGRAGCPQGPLQGYVSLDRSLTGLRWLLADLLCGPCSGLPGSGVWGSLGCCWWLGGMLGVPLLALGEDLMAHTPSRALGMPPRGTAPFPRSVPRPHPLALARCCSTVHRFLRASLAPVVFASLLAVALAVTSSPWLRSRVFPSRGGCGLS